jgi:beta-galactosidase
MRRLLFNDGWTCRPRADRFAELGGTAAEPTPVTLPHDAMIGTARSAEAGPANAYFPGGAWEYQCTLEVAPEDGAAGRTTLLEFEGVYRDAVVSVNGAIAARRPYGYSGFLVPIDHLLQPGENTIKVEATAHQDSRWYSGAGIYRNVWLLQGGPVHLVPDRIEVLTPEVGADGATVTVAATVRNTRPTTAVTTLFVELIDPAGAVAATVDAPVTVFAGQSVTSRQRLHLDAPQRWGPDHPSLYSCRLTLTASGGQDIAPATGSSHQNEEPSVPVAGTSRSQQDPATRTQVLDEDTSTFGIRSLALDARHGLRINGESVLLRGACVHHDNGPLGAATIDRADERRVELLKAAGFNALRSAHNPMSRAMLDACDRLGMLVMDETFDVWAQSKTSDDYSLRFDDWWEADVEAMVRRDVNHPSVVMYSIGNEIPDGSTPTGLQRGRALAEKVRALDPSRYVTQAVSGMLVAGPGVIAEIREIAAARMVDDETGVNTAIMNLGELMNEAMRSPAVDERTVEAFSHVDVAGYNYMDTRFAMDAERHPHRVMVGSETHPDRIDVGWSEVTQHPSVIGDFTWTGWDYLGEAGIGRTTHGDPNEAGALFMSAFHGDFPWVTAHCGDIDITGHRRPQSYYREIVFGLRSDPYVAVQRPEHHGRTIVHSSPWSWTDVISSWSWPDHEGAPVVIEVYAAADEVELLVNGRSLGRQPTGAEHRFRAEFEAVCEPGELVAVAWREAEEVGRTQLRSASGAVLLAAAADRTEIAAGTSDLAYIDIALTDATGTLFTTVDRPVTVDVDGPGALQGLASGRPDTDEAFTASTCTTHHGRALAVIRPTATGAITVRLRADGCEPVELPIDVG